MIILLNFREKKSYVLIIPIHINGNYFQACMERVTVTNSVVQSVERSCMPQDMCTSLQTMFSATCVGGPDSTCVLCDAFVCTVP